MRAIFCALLLAGSLFAQQEPTADSSNHKGSFYVDGIVYEYAASSEYTVVAAAHSVINRKFAAVKIRVYATAARAFHHVQARGHRGGRCGQESRAAADLRALKPGQQDAQDV